MGWRFVVKRRKMVRRMRNPSRRSRKLWGSVAPAPAVAAAVAAEMKRRRDSAAAVLAVAAKRKEKQEQGKKMRHSAVATQTKTARQWTESTRSHTLWVSALVQLETRKQPACRRRTSANL